jgi:hypothetical protein
MFEFFGILVSLDSDIEELHTFGGVILLCLSMFLCWNLYISWDAYLTHCYMGFFLVTKLLSRASFSVPLLWLQLQPPLPLERQSWSCRLFPTFRCVVFLFLHAFLVILSLFSWFLALFLLFVSLEYCLFFC